MSQIAPSTHRRPALLAAVFLLGLALGLGLPTSSAQAQAAAFPEPIPDDNGDYAFAREVVPLLLGRKPRGALEVKLLGDIAALEGRAAMVKMLTRREEFYIHWSRLLLDNLQVQRAGQRRQASACFAEPMRRTSDGTPVFDGGSLARFIAAQDPATASEPVGGDGFNMADVILSALQEDDLSVVMRAHLFSMAMARGRFTSPERARATVGTTFTHVYLTRSIGCLACHNETFSVTGPGSGWDRLYAPPINLSGALFGAASGGMPTNTFNLFRSDQAETGGTGLRPWNIDASCVTDQQASDRVGYRALSPNGGAGVAFAGLSGDDLGVVALEDTLRQGIESYRTDGLLLTPSGGDAPPMPDDAAVAFAYQVAMTVVDHVWEDLTGERLTIALYFPRNEAQRDALWNLTENVFLADDWSLSSLLATVLTSGYTNRRAPDNTVNDTYVLPMILDPWVAKDPRLPDSAFDDPNDPRLFHNGQGEVIHRHAPLTLLTMVSRALDWPDPNPYGGSGYPSSSFMRDIGQFWSQDRTGTRGVDFQSLLAWEATLGTCEKPPGVSTDWIDRLMDAIAVYDAENPYRPLILEDVILTLKDWVIQQGWIEDTAAQDTGLAEIAALSAVFSADTSLTVPMTAPTTLFTPADLEGKLREVCGALLQSPQFMLTGISAARPLEIPRLRVCNEPDDCSYQEMCESYADTLADASRYIDCLEDDVVPGSGPGVADRGDPCRVTVSVGGHQVLRVLNICEFVPNPLIECLRGDLPGLGGGGVPGPIRLGNDCRPDIPRCDPRCSIGAQAGGGLPGLEGGPRDGPGGLLGGGELGLPCCGGGGMRPFDRLDPETLLGWLEGAEILTARGAGILPRGKDVVLPLEPGTRLSFGDILVLPPEATVEARGPAGRVVLGGAGGGPEGMRPGLRPKDLSLLDAVRRGDGPAVTALLKDGANPLSVDREGRTALTIAAERRDTRILRELLQRGTSIGRPDARGLTAFEAARLARNPEAARLLERRGAIAERFERERPGKGVPPTLLMVTGPSAVKAPPVRDRRLMTTGQARLRLAEGAYRVKPPSLDARMGLLKEYGWMGPSLTGEQAERLNQTLQRLGPSDGVY
ncbi:ankyrin repeat domain-containing protein [Roseospira navarrensis]|uniref:DUF1549 domain-containing protein n=1 Tax=Roseospira navarrensis TaxID=140058 RepID=A0A7X1ZFK4_9PROT|nr:ankyrin repeat domain-containing protein [Roseospira navarrensis]MQX37437.1 hypothetical protein [Roseospira navarrensis]